MTTENKPRRPSMICLADVEPEDIGWLWPDRIPLGKLTVMSSDPGCGKSTVTMDMAARVSTGRAWPLVFGGVAPIGSVLFLSAEDGLADTIRPRLDAAGADVAKVHALDVQSIANHGLQALERSIEAIGDVRLVVIDPVSAYLGATDSHKNGEVRGLLKPLADVAEKWGTAIVCVSHLNKGSKTPAMYRTMGSLAFVAAARVAWTIVRDRGDRDRMLMLPLKNNIAPDMGGMAYRVVSAESNPKVGAIEWEKFPVHDDVNDAMDTEGSPRSVRVEERQALEAILHDALRDGRKSIADLLDMTKEQGFSEARTRRALRKIKARSVKDGSGGWYWYPPDDTGSEAAVSDVA